MPQVTIAEVYELLGRLATQFSALEHSVKHLLDGLLLGEDPFVYPLFIQSLSFHDAIQKCRTAARIRFIEDPEREDQVKDLMRRVGKMKERRNRFVHGRWAIDERMLPSISVYTFKLRRDPKGRLWELLDDHRMSISGLKAELGKVEELMFEVLKLSTSIK